jgi:hypothetical protein
MFIQTEATPNPVTLKFIPGKPVLSSGTAEYRSKSEADTSPLARRLFEIDGVTGVFLGSDFISVTKSDTEWQHLKPMVLGAIMEHYMSGAAAATSGAHRARSASRLIACHCAGVLQGSRTSGSGSCATAIARSCGSPNTRCSRSCPRASSALAWANIAATTTASRTANGPR